MLIKVILTIENSRDQRIKRAVLTLTDTI